MKQVKAYGTKAVNAPLEELTISRRSLRPSDVEFEVLLASPSSRLSLDTRYWGV